MAPLPDSPERPQDVLDRLLSTLRYERVAARKSGDVTQVTRIDAAIEDLEGQRAGMAYLRPASAYLRTSYPATSFQENEAGWQNMLFRHQLAQLPLVGEGLTNPKRSRLETVADVDKQFWQNVNRVRVAGGGRTNYVIAKDDIGNWYAKRYSADPTDVIQSAKGLLLYDVGQRQGVDLLEKTRASMEEDGEDAQPATSEDSTRLGRQVEALEDHLLEGRLRDYVELARLARDLPTKLTEGWEAKMGSQAPGPASVTALKKLLEDEPEGWNALVQEAELDVSGQMKEYREDRAKWREAHADEYDVVTAGRLVLSRYRNLKQAIQTAEDGLKDSLDTTVTGVATDPTRGAIARGEVDAQLGRPLQELVRARSTRLGEHSAAAGVVEAAVR